MKNANWFEHDYNARNDQKILMLRAEYGMEGYGIYWSLIETMAEDKGEIDRVAIGGLSLGYGVPKDRLKNVLDFCVKIGLFSGNENKVFSKRIKAHLEGRKLFQRKGLEGARKRWGNSPPNAKDKTRQEKEKKTNKKKARVLCSEKFLMWWDMYGKKVSRDKCFTKWKLFTDFEHDQILKLTPVYLMTDRVKRGFKVDPLTFLNQRRWEDDFNTYERPKNGKDVSQAVDEFTNMLRKAGSYPKSDDQKIMASIERLGGWNQFIAMKETELPFIVQKFRKVYSEI